MSLPRKLAALHAETMTGSARWSAGAFAVALEDPLCFLVQGDRPEDGFALGREVAGEAELLTLVVREGRRRSGLGRALLEAFEQAARARGADAAFLEVAADNIAAISLYERAGWRVVGQRTGYYDGTDAMAMRRRLDSHVTSDESG